MPNPGTYLPTDRIRFDGQLNLLRAYATIGQKSTQAITNEQIAEFAHLKPETASLANPFFANLKLISWIGGGYLPSDALRRYFRDVDEQRRPDPEQNLKPLFMETWFWRELAAALDNAHPQPIPIDEAMYILRTAADVGKNADSKLQILLEYLVFVGLIRLVGGDIFLAGEERSQEAPIASVPQYSHDMYIPFVFEARMRGVYVKVEIDPKTYKWTPNTLAEYMDGIGLQIGKAMDMNVSNEE